MFKKDDQQQWQSTASLLGGFSITAAIQLISINIKHILGSLSIAAFLFGSMGFITALFLTWFYSSSLNELKEWGKLTKETKFRFHVLQDYPQMTFLVSLLLFYLGLTLIAWWYNWIIGAILIFLLIMVYVLCVIMNRQMPLSSEFYEIMHPIDLTEKELKVFLLSTKGLTIGEIAKEMQAEESILRSLLQSSINKFRSLFGEGNKDLDEFLIKHNIPLENSQGVSK